MEHYYVKKPTTKSHVEEKKVVINQELFTFFTNSSVFSKKGLDFGTRTLLETLDLNKLTGKILDLGCGYGPIGIYISKKTGILIDMIDINERSLNLAHKNSIKNNVKTNIFYSDAYENIHEKYNLIISNPPIRVGKEKLYEILLGAQAHLIDGGELRIVIHKDQGAKTVAKNLSNYYSVTIVTKNKGFYVISAIKH